MYRTTYIGSTIIDSEQLPEHLVADEKHTKLKGQNYYIATTGAQECILGVSVANKADIEHLTEAYSVFKE